MARLTAFSLALSAALAGTAACAQELAAPTPQTPAAEAAAPETPAINEDEMADLLNSQQQITQGVTLTRSVNGQVVETKKETVVYSKDDPLRDSEAGVSPLERLKAQFDSQALTRKEALDEARSDFVVADLDRDGAMTADEFVYLVKGWESAEITGSGHGRFVDPFYHVDKEEADREHAEQARARFAAMAGAEPTLAKKAFTRKIVDEFEANDLDKDDLLRGDELLNFRASVRGETAGGR